MGRSGIFSEKDLHSHIDRIRSHGEWGTNTELNMIGALSRIDVMSIDVTDVDPNNWNIHPLYIHEYLEVPLECDPIYEGQKPGVIYDRIEHPVGMEHFDPFYQLLDSSTNFVCCIYFPYMTLLVRESIVQ